jgi:hypothetical protein
MFSLVDVDDGRCSVIMTFWMVFAAFILTSMLYPMSRGKLQVADSCKLSMKKIKWYPKENVCRFVLGCVEFSTPSSGKNINVVGPNQEN